MAISEQLDLISKEIGGKLDDNGNIEKQVQEIYDIIKSGAWPSGSGGSSAKGIGFIDHAKDPINSGTFVGYDAGINNLMVAVNALEENAWLVFTALQPVDITEVAGIGWSYQSVELDGRSWGANTHSGQLAMDAFSVPIFAAQASGYRPNVVNVKGSWKLYHMAYDEA
jgi:hypothetical protein